MTIAAKNSIINDLLAREGELQEAVNNAVKNGADSIKPRQQLKETQTKLAAARSDDAAMKAARRKAAAQLAARIGDRLAGEAIDRIVSNTRSFAEILNAGVPALDHAGRVSMTNAMHNVASARQILAKAEAEHAYATTVISDLASKIASKRQLLDELTRQSIAGEASESSHASRYAINEDIKTLDAMYAAASAQAASLAQPVNDARISLKNMDTQAAKTEHRLAADHLAAHAQALQDAYMSCVRAAQAEGAKAGVTIGALIPTSLALRTWIGTGQVINR